MYYDYEELDYGVLIQKYHSVTGMEEPEEPEVEVFLHGDEAIDFLRRMNRAEQKERSKRCNPGNIPICQNLMAKYF
jgi:hypothetical protein